MNILVIEDEGLIAMDLQGRLESFGHIVPAIGKTADDAIRLAAAHVPDLILMDIYLKGKKDGIYAAEEIRKKYDVPIIFLTAHADTATIDRAKMTEPFGYIVKPFNAIDIRVQIEIAFHKHQIECKLRSSEAWFSTTLRTMGEAVIATKIDGSIEFMNSAAERLTGWTLRQALGAPFGRVVPLERAGVPMTGNLVRLAALIEEPFSLGPNLVLTSCQGRRHEVEGEISAHAPVAGQAAMTIFTLREVTQRRWREQQDREAHAIRSVERLVDTATQAAGALELSGIVRGLSPISSNARLVTRREININEMIERLVQVVSNSLAPIVIKTELTPGIHPISANWNQLELILLAFIRNAQDAIPGEGSILLSTHNVVMESEQPSKAPRHMITIRVRDSGAGMDKETCDRIFEPFFTTKEDKVAHPGLGMCIAQGVIQDYHGFLNVKSAPGTGTEVTLGIPAIDEDPFAYLDESPDSRSDAKTILIVDEDPGVRQFLRKIFTEKGYAVVESRDAQEVLTIAELRAGPIDVVLTLGYLSGAAHSELVGQFASLHPETRFLLLGSDVPQPAGIPEIPFRQQDILSRVKHLLSEAAGEANQGRAMIHAAPRVERI